MAIVGTIDPAAPAAPIAPSLVSARGRTAVKVALGVVFIIAIATAGAVILPDALPSLLQAIHRNPVAPVVVAAFWLAATTASIAGKRVLAGGRLTWYDTTCAHITGTVVNRVIPAGAGGAGTYLLALRKGGLTSTQATGAVAIWAAAAGLAHAGGLLVGAAWLRAGATGLAAVVLLLAVAMAVAPAPARRFRGRASSTAGTRRVLRWQPRGPRSARVERAVRYRASRARCALGDLLMIVRERPSRTAGALAAQLVSLTFLAAGFAAAVSIVGLEVPIGAALAAYLAGTAMAAAVPTPAGIGSSEAALAGALVMVGASMGEALPAVLLFRAVILLAPVVAALFVMGAWPTRSAQRRTT